MRSLRIPVGTPGDMAPAGRHRRCPEGSGKKPGSSHAVGRLDPRDNLLLAALPQEERERWQACLEGVELAAGQLLHEARQPPRYAYFPLDAVVSLQVQSEDGGCDEVAIVGREGMVGVAPATPARPPSWVEPSGPSRAPGPLPDEPPHAVLPALSRHETLRTA